MALFKSAVLLEDKPEPVTIKLGHIVEDDKKLLVTITVEMSDKLREVYRQVDDKYRFAPQYTFTKGSQKPTGKIVNDPVQFCHELLNAGYKDSENLVDIPSKKAVLAALRKEIGFAKTLANKFVDLFDNDELFQNEEDDEKN